jgi:hypothetical protein
MTYINESSTTSKIVLLMKRRKIASSCVHEQVLYEKWFSKDTKKAEPAKKIDELPLMHAALIRHGYVQQKPKNFTTGSGTLQYNHPEIGRAHIGTSSIEDGKITLNKPQAIHSHSKKRFSTGAELESHLRKFHDMKSEDAQCLDANVLDEQCNPVLNKEQVTMKSLKTFMSEAKKKFDVSSQSPMPEPKEKAKVVPSGKNAVKVTEDAEHLDELTGKGKLEDIRGHYDNEYNDAEHEGNNKKAGIAGDKMSRAEKLIKLRGRMAASRKPAC